MTDLSGAGQILGNLLALPRSGSHDGGLHAFALGISLSDGHDAVRLPHVKHEDGTAICHYRRLDHEADRFRHGHEETAHRRMGYGYRQVMLHLPGHGLDEGSATAEYIAEPHRCDDPWRTDLRRDRLGQSLGRPEYRYRPRGLICRDVDQSRVITGSQRGDHVCAANVRQDPNGRCTLQQWQVLARGCMKHQARAKAGKKLSHLLSACHVREHKRLILKQCPAGLCELKPVKRVLVSVD